MELKVESQKVRCEVISRMMLILIIVPLVIFAFILAGVLGARKGNGEHLERGNEMIKTIYVYVILFATLMMTIGGTVAAFMAVADIVSPSAYVQTFEQYKTMPNKGDYPTPVKQEQTLSDAELKSRYDQMVSDEKSMAKERAVNSLIKSFGWIVVPLPIFIFFQRKVKKQPV